MVVIALLLVATTVALRYQPATESVVAAAPEPVVEAPLQAGPDRVALGVRIRKGATISQILTGWGLPVVPVVDAAREHYDLVTIRPDRELVFVFEGGHRDPVAIEYAIDEDRTLVVSRVEGAWDASLEEVEYTEALGDRDVMLEHSLWEDGIAAGLRPDDIVRLAQIFEYEVDFNSELRAGARFSLVGQILSNPERPDKLGDLHAVRLDNGGKVHVAVRHVLPSGEVGWFHPDGSGMKRPFLRSPLEFMRVTSSFNLKRFHPVLKKRRPHYGVDFGAPTGTPVRAVADGLVVSAGRNGGHGNYVKLDHEGPYHTSYSHLSRILVKKGQRVRQGQLVGKVGATGLATGPHLHYQMWKNGSYVDPMKIDLPNSASLPASQKSAFKAVVAKWLPQLPGAVTPESASSTASEE